MNRHFGLTDLIAMLYAPVWRSYRYNGAHLFEVKENSAFAERR
jgi:hypothetical protein